MKIAVYTIALNEEKFVEVLEVEIGIIDPLPQDRAQRPLQGFSGQTELLQEEPLGWLRLLGHDQLILLGW